MTAGELQPSRFFIPNTSKTKTETVYTEMKEALVDQLRFTIQERRIFKLHQASGKRTWRFEVGKPKPQESHYIVMAIFEASVFVVVNQTLTGIPGPIVLLDKAEVTGIEEFRE